MVAAVAAHSLVLGIAMLLQPLATLTLTGWDYRGPAFFPAQSGIFLLVLGGAYVVGVWRVSFAWLLVASKAAAVVFLVTAYSLGAVPNIALLAALLDGVMGIGVAAALLWEMRSA